MLNKIKKMLQRIWHREIIEVTPLWMHKSPRNFEQKGIVLHEDTRARRFFKVGGSQAITVPALYVERMKAQSKTPDNSVEVLLVQTNEPEIIIRAKGGDSTE